MIELHSETHSLLCANLSFMAIVVYKCGVYFLELKTDRDLLLLTEIKNSVFAYR